MVDLIGAGKCIDTTAYTVLAFNIPGNGFNSQSLDDLKLDYKDFTARDVAGLFAQGLDQLNESQANRSAIKIGVMKSCSYSTKNGN